MRFLCPICHLHVEVCFTIKSWRGLILECASMIVKYNSICICKHERNLSGWLVINFETYFLFVRPEFAQKVLPNKSQTRNHVLVWDILKENIFHEAVHIDKSRVPFNALTEKGQLITVCLRATCKDRSIKWVWKKWARRSAVLPIYISWSIKYTN